MLLCELVVVCVLLIGLIDLIGLVDLIESLIPRAPRHTVLNNLPKGQAPGGGLWGHTTRFQLRGLGGAIKLTLSPVATGKAGNRISV